MQHIASISFYLQLYPITKKNRLAKLNDTSQVTSSTAGLQKWTNSALCHQYAGQLSWRHMKSYGKEQAGTCYYSRYSTYCAASTSDQKVFGVSQVCQPRFWGAPALSNRQFCGATALSDRQWSILREVFLDKNALVIFSSSQTMTNYFSPRFYFGQIERISFFKLRKAEQKNDILTTATIHQFAEAKHGSVSSLWIWGAERLLYYPEPLGQRYRHYW